MDNSSSSGSDSLVDISLIESNINEAEVDRERLSVKLWVRKYGCKLDQYMSAIKVLKNKGSASDSIIMFGNLTVKKQVISVVFKMVFKPKNKLNNSLLVEQQIYENVISNLINNYHTPHIVNYIGTVNSCVTDTFTEDLSLAESKNFEEAKSKIRMSGFDSSVLDIMILEKSSGYTLNQCVDEEVLSTLDKFKVLFQILYTLLCFERIKLTHNDLHFNNIFIDKLDKPIERIYYLDSTRWVKFTTSYDAKIYDFDRGAIYHPAVDRNLTIDKQYCEAYETCNSFDPKRDLGSVIAGYLLNELNPEFMEFLFPLTSQKFRDDIANRDYFQLNSSHSRYTDEDLKPTAEYLNLVVAKISDAVTGEGKNNGNIYTLPEKRNHTFWYPSTSQTHKNSKVDMSDESVNNYDKEYINDVFIDARDILNLKLYNKELTAIYEEHKQPSYHQTCKLLFTEFLRKKNVHNKYHETYMLACFILCLPFTYKFTSDEMVYFINDWLPRNRDPTFGSKLSMFISDVWNTFDNLLPVKMVRM
ncbi:MAG: hypothetical protein PHG66_00840 [Candidatus Colwellbacteria bacterium]|nr:hypothetical protein [Candidatus Colwellbacteria bacterium]